MLDEDQRDGNLYGEQFNLQKGFDRLICLNECTNIAHLEHQIQTALKVLKKMRGPYQKPKPTISR